MCAWVFARGARFSGALFLLPGIQSVGHRAVRGKLGQQFSSAWCARSQHGEPPVADPSGYDVRLVPCCQSCAPTDFGTTEARSRAARAVMEQLVHEAIRGDARLRSVCRLTHVAGGQARRRASDGDGGTTCGTTALVTSAARQAWRVRRRVLRRLLFSLCFRLHIRLRPNLMLCLRGMVIVLAILGAVIH